MLKNKKTLMLGAAGLLTVTLVSANLFLNNAGNSLSESGLAQIVGSTKEAKPKTPSTTPPRPAAPKTPNPTPPAPKVKPPRIPEGECDPVETFKKAIDMLKKSCYDPEYISGLIGNLDTKKINWDTKDITDPIQPEAYSGNFMGGSSKTTIISLDLGNVEVRMGHNSTERRGDTELDVGNTKDKRHKKEGTPDVNDTPDANVIIQINLNDKMSCDEEKMKVALFHELVHEQQLRRLNFGFWDKDKKHVQRLTTDPNFGDQSVDPRRLVNSCMEAEAHLVTARCIQKEQKIKAYEKYKDTMNTLLTSSKTLGKSFTATCANYINSVKNNMDSNPDKGAMMNNNKIIWDSYLENWYKKMKGLMMIYFEKFYFDPKDKPAQALPKEKLFKQFVDEKFAMPGGDAQRLIDAWKLIVEQEKQGNTSPELLPKNVMPTFTTPHIVPLTPSTPGTGNNVNIPRILPQEIPGTYNPANNMLGY